MSQWDLSFEPIKKSFFSLVDFVPSIDVGHLYVYPMVTNSILQNILQCNQAIQKAATTWLLPKIKVHES